MSQTAGKKTKKKSTKPTKVKTQAPAQTEVQAPLMKNEQPIAPQVTMSQPFTIAAPVQYVTTAQPIAYNQSSFVQAPVYAGAMPTVASAIPTYSAGQAQLAAQFSALDRNGDGQISRAEFAAGYR